MPPAYLFAFLLATLFGVLFHVWKGGGAGRLGFYILLSWLGFLGGHLFGNSLNWSLIYLGPVHIDFAVLGAIASLLIGHFLVPKKNDRH